MAKQKITTKTTKKYRYSSFKARIDDIKIEPVRNLEKRVHDYVETSHFLASFQHWQDTNLSANFTEFAGELATIVQTLPQILYHEEKIFNTLIEFVGKHDERSLQPLLDLMAQFCHDLGPDFLKFYKSAVLSLVSLLEAAIDFESTNVFEWSFNCLAYIFKYLSRLLVEDLTPTFDMLFPLLSHTKEYISRFAAEALSFLVRKSKPKGLRKLVNQALMKLPEAADSNLYSGLLSLFSESLTTTPGALHSKSKMMFGILVEESFAVPNREKSIPLVCDVWMQITRHASAENIAPLYEGTLSLFEQELNQDLQDDMCRILSTMIFAESGKKVPDWSALVHTIELILERSGNERLLPDTLVFLFSVLLRNCDVRNLTQCHKKLFDFFLEKKSANFLQFFSLALDFAPESVVSFNGPRYFQKFLDEHSSVHAEGIALFSLKINSQHTRKTKLKICFPDAFIQSILKSFLKSTLEDLYYVFWNTELLTQSETDNFSSVNTVLKALLAFTPRDGEYDFFNDTIGLLLQAITLSKPDQFNSVLHDILKNFARFRSSIYFIRGLNRIFKRLNTLNNAGLIEVIQRYDGISLELTKNLLLPDSAIRYESLELLETLLNVQTIEVPRIVIESKNVEQIPLTLQNGRTITSRIRLMGEEFAKTEPTELNTALFFRHIFGLLTARFSPVWEGIFEILPNVYRKNTDLVWECILHLLNAADNNGLLRYPEDQFADETTTVLWESKTDRLEAVLKTFGTSWDKFSSVTTSILNIAKERRGTQSYPQHLRTQILKVMLALSEVTEKHSRDIVSFILNAPNAEKVVETEAEASDSTIQNASSWQEVERNLLLKIFGKFTTMKNIYKSEEVYERLLELLGSRHIEVQKLALNALFGYRIPALMKYKDNLRNLLDDTIFKDEITNLLLNNTTSVVNESDESELYPFLLRILFGRAQTPATSGIKKSRKVAVLGILPSLKEHHIISFLKLGSDRLNYSYFYQNGNKIDGKELSLGTLRRMTGFVTILNSALDVLGSKYPRAIITILRPLIYCIAVSYASSGANINDNFMVKTASSLRQLSLKCLNVIFENVGNLLPWENYLDDLYDNVIKPRIASFPDENLQQPSSLLRIKIYWTSNKNLYPFLYHDNFAVVNALMETLSNEHAKESVTTLIIQGSNQLIKNPSKDKEYVELVAMIASACLQTLPKLYQKATAPETVSAAVEMLLNMTEFGYVQDNETRKYLLESLSFIMEAKFKSVSHSDISKILKILCILISDYDCSWNEVESLYKFASKLYQIFTEKELRLGLNALFLSLASRFEDIANAARIVDALNSYSSKRIQEYDFPRMLSAFKQFNEVEYKTFTDIQWLPILYNCLYLINDENELAIRTNASHTLSKFVDFINEKESKEAAVNSCSLLKSIVLPSVRNGLRAKTEEIQAEYISVLGYIVSNSKYFTELDDMKVLLVDGDEEASFFSNISHIQLHRRQRTIKRLTEHTRELSDNSVAHYLIPMIEHYVFSEEDKYRNIGNEALATIGVLSQAVTWNQYRSLLRRYISMMKNKKDALKKSVLLVNRLSVSLRDTLIEARKGSVDALKLKKFPSNIAEAEDFITNEVYPTLCKILGTRDDETIVMRTPLTEASVNFILGLTEDKTASMLPGILTAVCQVLRSKSEELRDAVGGTLARVSVILGPRYLIFILKELKSALQRGSQVHVLGFTVHHVLRDLSDSLKHGDLDDCAYLLSSVIMENTFGAAGLEKESDNYHTKMKEVKVNKSYDIAEMITKNISLPIFNDLLRPVKALLLERINLKNQNKLAEILRRYSIGLTFNESASSKQMLSLCYEIFQQAETEANKHFNRRDIPQSSEQEDFFLVNLKVKNTAVLIESTVFTSTLQKFALDLLKTVISKHRQLLDITLLEGFIPLLREALTSENEGVLTSALRVLVIIVKLHFSEDSEPIFKNCARKVLNLIKDSPSTSSELCQMGLKFLSSFIRHKDVKLKETALSYIVGRILPDLYEPSKQGLAFNFLRALVSKHIALPELYDVIDTVREIMITNHSKEIRDVSRSVFYQFLMEYDQSKGRLEKQFKFMVDNLQYPAQEGRQSVLELLNLFIVKANPALLSKLSSSFFLALSNVSYNDDSPKCREMATILLGNLLKKLDDTNLNAVNKYVSAWLRQEGEVSFVSLGLRIYKIYIDALSVGKSEDLDRLAINRIKSVLSDINVGSEIQWDMIYTALNVFLVYSEKSSVVFTSSYKLVWDQIIGCLLYPHMWVRELAVRLVNFLIDNLDSFEVKFTDYEIQTICTRILRQLSAPSISDKLSTVAIKTVVQISSRWSKADTKYIFKNQSQDEEVGTELKYSSAIQFMVTRIGATIRSEDKAADAFASKKANIQLFALLCQVLNNEQLLSAAEHIVLALYTYLEADKRNLTEEQEELGLLAQECVQILESRVSVSDFTRIYTAVRQTVIKRRQERRAKRSILAVNAPGVAAERKLKKHARSREKRRHEKDENGYYQRKNQKRRA
ncbi:Utp20p KNAG_0K01470 [Huiozyma naganishii CBS 8797]|uniref:Uncharacterized protein n=1 Tax=Huiozyma naganishii (strain ATCC MYA-139 / BCRC 22969 / CBS 8797 / KCTC 17520 / NBRC 10181 / NCYC 3082 / Yp74L-3) TaxID=1071383 RepID=J7RRN8_HUIN7|nr:hypothetical protein KNAG_0K01470 [Kazachstania naganishii CBS 8797]CCK72508.1 hypothetical protein KNAG_0K01470 [Kazachstania naganishii CBS 8797]